MIWFLVAIAVAQELDAPSAARPWEAWPRAAAPGAPRGDDPVVETAIDAMAEYVDLPWTWGGRATARNPGIDCLGLLFRGYGRATDTSWWDYPVDPSKIVSGGMLGQPVAGLAGVARGEVPYERLRRGDIVYFLRRNYKIEDAPLWHDAGADYWPWHTGVYVDEGHRYVLNAHPAYDVIRIPIDDVRWDALYVTRPHPGS